MLVIGIAGGSGSGKTTFTQKVKAQAKEKISTLHLDSYYQSTPPAHLLNKSGNINFDHPDAFDWDLLRKHLNDLRNNLSVDSPTYDFSNNKRGSQVQRIEPSNIVLFEGIFALFDTEIRNYLDIKCFLHVDSDIRFSRRLHRDIQSRGRSLDSVIEQYYETVRPMHQKYLEPQRQFADFIVGEETDVAASILTAKINSHLDQIGK